MPERGADMFVAIGSRKMEKAPLVTSGVYLAMVRCTGAEVAAMPMLSDATAVRVCRPSAKVKGPVVKRKGLAGILRSNVPPSKNDMFVTVPSVSVTSAPMVMLSVFPKAAWSGGFVMVTLSVGFVAPTDIFTMLDVAERPPLSVATAVSAWLPAAKVAVTV